MVSGVVQCLVVYIVCMEVISEIVGVCLEGVIDGMFVVVDVLFDCIVDVVDEVCKGIVVQGDVMFVMLCVNQVVFDIVVCDSVGVFVEQGEVMLVMVSVNQVMFDVVVCDSVEVLVVWVVMVEDVIECVVMWFDLQWILGDIIVDNFNVGFGVVEVWIDVLYQQGIECIQMFVVLISVFGGFVDVMIEVL